MQKRSYNHSGDSDSTGSITGNILGLINGEESINKQWIEKLDAHDIVSQMGEDLFIRVKGSTYETDEEWWEKYPGFYFKTHLKKRKLLFHFIFYKRYH